MSAPKTESEKKQEETLRKIQEFEPLLHGLERNLKRTDSIEDPVIKYSLLVDKLCMFMDTAMCLMESHMNDAPDDFKARLHRVSDKINDDLTSLMSWIRQPIYSPDHPYGRNVMKDAASSFSDASNTH
jgi:hypothetical protein